MLICWFPWKPYSVSISWIFPVRRPLDDPGLCSMLFAAPDLTCSSAWPYAYPDQSLWPINQNNLGGEMGWPDRTPGVQCMVFMAALFLNHLSNHGCTHLEIFTVSLAGQKSSSPPHQLFTTSAPSSLSFSHTLCSRHSKLLPISKQMCTFVLLPLYMLFHLLGIPSPHLLIFQVPKSCPGSPGSL